MGQNAEEMRAALNGEHWGGVTCLLCPPPQAPALPLRQQCGRDERMCRLGGVSKADALARLPSAPPGKCRRAGRSRPQSRSEEIRHFVLKRVALPAGAKDASTTAQSTERSRYKNHTRSSTSTPSTSKMAPAKPARAVRARCLRLGSLGCRAADRERGALAAAQLADGVADADPDRPAVAVREGGNCQLGSAQ